MLKPDPAVFRRPERQPALCGGKQGWRSIIWHPPLMAYNLTRAAGDFWDSAGKLLKKWT